MFLFLAQPVFLIQILTEVQFNPKNNVIGNHSSFITILQNIVKVI
jgi:hypothetical protein